MNMDLSTSVARSPGIDMINQNNVKTPFTRLNV